MDRIRVLLWCTAAAAALALAGLVGFSMGSAQPTDCSTYGPCFSFVDGLMLMAPALATAGSVAIVSSAAAIARRPSDG